MLDVDTLLLIEHHRPNMTPPFAPLHGLKISLAPTFLVLGLALAMPGLAADKKLKATPSTLPPTAPTLAIPPVDPGSSGDQSAGKLISSEMSGSDLAFFTAAVAAGREQSFFVGLLKGKANSDQTKSFAGALNETQEEENTHLAKLAALKGWNVSLEPTPAQKKEAAGLDKLTGADYDKAVMDKIVAASHQAMTAYQNAAQSSDPDIKKFASQMLPLAEEKRHLIEKMTGTRNKAATPAPVATPPGKRGPGTTPATSTPTSGKADPAAKPTPTPKPTVTPTPPPFASTRPIATPPGQILSADTPAPILPPILPSKSAASRPVPTPLLPSPYK
jgi:putative membrane protein